MADGPHGGQMENDDLAPYAVVEPSGATPVDSAGYSMPDGFEGDAAAAPYSLELGGGHSVYNSVGDYDL